MAFIKKETVQGIDIDKVNELLQKVETSFALAAAKYSSISYSFDQAKPLNEPTKSELMAAIQAGLIDAGWAIRFLGIECEDRDGPFYYVIRIKVQ